MPLQLSDVLAPVGPCPAAGCGGELLLETHDIEKMENNLVVRCWKCGLTEPCDLTYLEKFVHKMFDGVFTWRARTVSDEFPQGFIVTGKSLFTTSDEIVALHATAQDEGAGGTAAQKLVQIYDREEAIGSYLAAGNTEDAYHMASAPHNCAIIDGHSPMVCQENVNWICTSTGGLIGEYFNMYGFILLAWRRLAEQLAKDDTDITNEEEVRIAFIDCLKEVNTFGYTFKAWGERSIVLDVDGKDIEHLPDVQLQDLVVLELKSFLRTQKYNAAQARSLIKEDIEKLKNYEGHFSVGFLLCLSNKFTVEQMNPGALPKYNYPVRALILSTT